MQSVSLAYGATHGFPVCPCTVQFVWRRTTGHRMRSKSKSYGTRYQIARPHDGAQMCDAWIDVRIRACPCTTPHGLTRLCEVRIRARMRAWPWRSARPHTPMGRTFTCVTFSELEAQTRDYKSRSSDFGERMRKAVSVQQRCETGGFFGGGNAYGTVHLVSRSTTGR